MTAQNKRQVVDAMGGIVQQQHYDETADAYQVSQYIAGLQPTYDLPLAIARGLVPGHAAGNKAGRNADIDSTTADIISQGGIYTPPTAARIHAIVSDSAADAAAGTGARTILINGLDANYAEVNETVTLNGTTPVNTTTAYVFINRMVIDTTGTGLVNTGNITATAATDNTVSAKITVGYGQAAMAVYMVPAGVTMFIQQYSGSITGGTDVAINLMTKPFGRGWRKRGNINLHTTGTSNDTRTYPGLLLVTEKTLVKLQATAAGNNTDVSGTIDYILVTNP